MVVLIIVSLMITSATYKPNKHMEKNARLKELRENCLAMFKEINDLVDFFTLNMELAPEGKQFIDFIKLQELDVFPVIDFEQEYKNYIYKVTAFRQLLKANIDKSKENIEQVKRDRKQREDKVKTVKNVLASGKSLANFILSDHVKNIKLEPVDVNMLQQELEGIDKDVADAFAKLSEVVDEDKDVDAMISAAVVANNCIRRRNEFISKMAMAEAVDAGKQDKAKKAKILLKNQITNINSYLAVKGTTEALRTKVQEAVNYVYAHMNAFNDDIVNNYNLYVLMEDRLSVYKELEAEIKKMRNNPSNHDSVYKFVK